MIWFYPLNELEITGYEAFAVVIFSPFLVSMPFLQKIFRNRWVIALLRSVVYIIYDLFFSKYSVTAGCAV
jgi:hypothetical protein